jgi:hypothetical protein
MQWPCRHTARPPFALSRSPTAWIRTMRAGAMSTCTNMHRTAQLPNLRSALSSKLWHHKIPEAGACALDNSGHLRSTRSATPVHRSSAALELCTHLESCSPMWIVVSGAAPRSPARLRAAFCTHACVHDVPLPRTTAHRAQGRFRLQAACRRYFGGGGSSSQGEEHFLDSLQPERPRGQRTQRIGERLGTGAPPRSPAPASKMQKAGQGLSPLCG